MRSTAPVEIWETQKVFTNNIFETFMQKNDPLHVSDDQSKGWSEAQLRERESRRKLERERRHALIIAIYQYNIDHPNNPIGRRAK